MAKVTRSMLDSAFNTLSKQISEVLTEADNGFTASGLRTYQRLGSYMDEITSLYLAVDSNGNVEKDEFDRRSLAVQNIITTAGDSGND